MTRNNAVIYKGPMSVAIEDIGYPKMEVKGKPVDHGVILKIVATNICGSELHMYRGRTDLAPGTPIGHEITGEIIEKGRDVEFLSLGDLVSVPFNVACRRCQNCKEQYTNLCLTTNDLKPGAAYGYAEMGPWQGGQAEYIFIPYADFNLLKFPDKAQAMEKIADLTLLSDIFPTGYYGAIGAGVTTGSIVYIAGAGPVGLAAAVSSYSLGAACVIVADYNTERLEYARQNIGCQILNIANCITPDDFRDNLNMLCGQPEVDCGIDAIGYEAHGHGHDTNKGKSTDALDTLIEITRPTGRLGIAGVYLAMDPKADTKESKMGRPPFELGRAWDKGLHFNLGQTPTMKYNRQLMNLILHDRVQIAKALNVTVIGMDDAPDAYKIFEKGVMRKFVLDPQNILKRDAEFTKSQDLVAA